MANFWAKSDLKSDPSPLGMSGLKPAAVLSESPTNKASNVAPILYLKKKYCIIYSLQNAVLHNFIFYKTAVCKSKKVGG